TDGAHLGVVDDPVQPVTGQFPLGRAFGLLSTSEEMCPPEALPFGLRCAVQGTYVSISELSAYGYDSAAQIGSLRDGDRVVPLCRHTTGQTRTATNRDGHKGPDSDTDQRED